MISSSSVVSAWATICPLGATMHDWASESTPSSTPPLATPTTHVPFWYAPDWSTSALWKPWRMSWLGSGA